MLTGASRQETCGEGTDVKGRITRGSRAGASFPASRRCWREPGVAFRLGDAAKGGGNQVCSGPDALGR